MSVWVIALIVVEVVCFAFAFRAAARDEYAQVMSRNGLFTLGDFLALAFLAPFVAVGAIPYVACKLARPGLDVLNRGLNADCTKAARALRVEAPAQKCERQGKELAAVRARNAELERDLLDAHH